MGVQNVQKVAHKIKCPSQVVKLAGKIRIDLTVIFRMCDFFYVILSFWDMIDFVFFPFRPVTGGGVGLHAHAEILGLLTFLASSRPLFYNQG